MRVIYLTLGLFILLGIGATCRTPPLLPHGCAEPPCPQTLSDRDDTR
jgi:hypothetical protein